MRKKLNRLSLCCFILAVITFALAYLMFHYLSPTGFTAVWSATARKPFVTELVGNLGVLLLFGSIMSLIIGRIFFNE